MSHAWLPSLTTATARLLACAWTQVGVCVLPHVLHSPLLPCRAVPNSLAAPRCSRVNCVCSGGAYRVDRGDFETGEGGGDVPRHRGHGRFCLPQGQVLLRLAWCGPAVLILACFSTTLQLGMLHPSAKGTSGGRFAVRGLLIVDPAGTVQVSMMYPTSTGAVGVRAPIVSVECVCQYTCSALLCHGCLPWGAFLVTARCMWCVFVLQEGTFPKSFAASTHCRSPPSTRYYGVLCA